MPAGRDRPPWACACSLRAAAGLSTPDAPAAIACWLPTRHICSISHFRSWGRRGHVPSPPPLPPTRPIPAPGRRMLATARRAASRAASTAPRPGHGLVLGSGSNVVDLFFNCRRLPLPGEKGYFSDESVLSSQASSAGGGGGMWKSVPECGARKPMPSQFPRALTPTLTLRSGVGVTPPSAGRAPRACDHALRPMTGCAAVHRPAVTPLPSCHVCHAVAPLSRLLCVSRSPAAALCPRLRPTGGCAANPPFTHFAATDGCPPTPAAAPGGGGGGGLSPSLLRGPATPRSPHLERAGDVRCAVDEADRAPRSHPCGSRRALRGRREHLGVRRGVLVGRAACVVGVVVVAPARRPARRLHVLLLLLRDCCCTEGGAVTAMRAARIWHERTHPRPPTAAA
jgi:hypothetical protein